MPSLPTSLALTTIADGASIIAADHRNNYASVQTAVNALIAAESGGTAGQFLSATSATAVAWAGSYTAFTPAWTCSGTAPAIGNATVTARYLQIGKLVHYYGMVTFGTTSTFGTGTFLFSLPVSALSATPRPLGVVELFDSSATAVGTAVGQFQSATTFSAAFGATYLGVSTPIGQTTPWTWATSDFVAWNLLYEAA